MKMAWAAKCESHTQKLVLVALADRANEVGFCWPSIGTIAADCSLSEQGVRNQILICEKNGLLFVDRSPGRTSNRYTLTLHRVEGSTPNEIDPTPRGPSTVLGVTPHTVEGQPPTACRSTPHRVDPNSKEPSDEPKREPSRRDGFESFWTAYPRKVGKGKAVDSWEKNKCSRIVEKIVLAVKNAKRSKDWMKEDGRYIPNPTTWLNQERWDDEPEMDEKAEPVLDLEPGEPTDYVAMMDEFKRKREIAENTMRDAQ